MVIVGSITGNTNTLAGNVPPKADLGDLSGLAGQASMIDGKEFDGAKAYKDSKVGCCKSTGSLGCFTDSCSVNAAAFVRAAGLPILFSPRPFGLQMCWHCPLLLPMSDVPDLKCANADRAFAVV